MRKYFHELWVFTYKQAWACLFGGLLLFFILVSAYWYPIESLPRYDFLFLIAIAIQVFLLVFKLETWKEAGVIIIFHVVATGMEIFKTSEAIGSWHYPEDALFKIANVPLFAGFMYSAVGSYIARIWRIFDFRFERYPLPELSYIFCLAVYINFFSHHYIYDFRWVLLLGSVLLFGRTWIIFTVHQQPRRMPLVIGWLLVALFIWFAENISTFARVWLYPVQDHGWQAVSPQKMLAWYLLMIISFILVSMLRRPSELRTGSGTSGLS